MKIKEHQIQQGLKSCIGNCWKSCHPASLFRKFAGNSHFLKKHLVVWSHYTQKYVKGPSPSYAPKWSNKGSNGKPDAHKVWATGLECLLDRMRVSSCLQTCLNLLIVLQSLAQWAATDHKLCLLGISLTKTAPRHLLYKFFFCLRSVFQLPKL